MHYYERRPPILCQSYNPRFFTYVPACLIFCTRRIVVWKFFAFFFHVVDYTQAYVSNCLDFPKSRVCFMPLRLSVRVLVGARRSINIMHKECTNRCMSLSLFLKLTIVSNPSHPTMHLSWSRKSVKKSNGCLYGTNRWENIENFHARLRSHWSIRTAYTALLRDRYYNWHGGLLRKINSDKQCGGSFDAYFFESQ